MSLFLALDGGGTHTRAALYDSSRRALAEAESGPSNPVLVGIDAAIRTLVALARGLAAAQSAPIIGAAAGIAGAGCSGAAEPIARALCRDLHIRRAVATDDIRPILFANAGPRPAVVVVAGTGSSIIAQAQGGRCVVLGGRGVLFGDDGSAHQLAVCGLRAAADAIDGIAPATALATALPQALGLSGFKDVVFWAAAAPKSQVADLAKTVASAADEGDAVAAACIRDQAARLARRTAAAFAKAALPDVASVYLVGGVLETCSLFRNEFEKALVRLKPGARPTIPELRGHRAVLELALAPSLPEGLMAAIESGD